MLRWNQSFAGSEWKEKDLVGRKGSFGLGLNTGMRAVDIVKWSKEAEANGFDSVWISEDPYFRDSLPITTSIGINTSKIKIATCILNIYTKNPVYMAMAAATIDEISTGRLILGLGRGVKSLIEGELHIPYGSYLTYVREYIPCVMKLLAGQSVTYEGKEIKLSGAKLRFNPLRPKIPILLAAMGPKMLKLAGSLADGAILNSCTSVSHAAFASKILSSSWKSRVSNFGRESRPILACALWTSIDEDLERAYESVRTLVGFLLSIPGFGEVFLRNTTKLKMDFLPELRTAFHWDEKVGDPMWHLERADPIKVKQLVNNEIVDSLTVCGSIENCKKRIAKYFEAGVSTAIINPVTPMSFAKLPLLLSGN
jgi:5,10-methylenetetrahydromethanopterin reductase